MMITANGEEIPFEKKINLGGRGLQTFYIERCDVGELYLSSNQLSEFRIPNGGLPRLERLHLSGNQLSEFRIPEGGLPNLKELYLSFNQLSEFQIQKGGLPNLKKLVLSDNQLSEFRIPEEGLPKLEVLWLYNNRLSELRIPEGGLSNLKMLDLSYNPLEILEGGLPLVERVYLTRTKVKFVDPYLHDKVCGAFVEKRLHSLKIIPAVWNLPQPIAEEIVEHITL